MLNSITERKTFEWKSLSTLNVLPYQDFNDVNLKRQSNMGDAMVINNSLRRMVDNDLYNEQLILNIKEGRNVPGATVTNLSSVVIDSPENHKFALTSIANIADNHPYQIVIGKKKIADNDDQVSSVPFFEGKHVNFYIYDGRMWVVGTKDGLYCSGERLSGWHRVGEQGDDYLQSNFKGIDCRCCIRNIYQGSFKNDLDKYEFFLGTGDRVYGFNTALEFGEVAKWDDNVHPNLIGITPNKLYLDKKERCLFVCTTTGLYKCIGSECIRENKTYQYDIPSLLCLEGDDLTRANERLLIATDTGVKQSTNAYYPQSIVTIVKSFLAQKKFPDKSETKMEVTSLGLNKERTEVVFFGTSDGLRVRNPVAINDQSQYYAPADANISKEFTFGIEYAGDCLYVGHRAVKNSRTGVLERETSPGSKTFTPVGTRTGAVNNVKDIYNLPYNCLLVTSFASAIYLIDTNENETEMYKIESYDTTFGEPNSVTVNGEDIYVASTNGIHIFKIVKNYYIRLDGKSWMYGKNILYAKKSELEGDDSGWVSLVDSGTTKAFLTDGKLSSRTQIASITTGLGMVAPLARNSYLYTTSEKGINWSSKNNLSTNVIHSDMGNGTVRRISRVDSANAMCLTERNNRLIIDLVSKNGQDLSRVDILDLGTGTFNSMGRPNLTYFNDGGYNMFAVFTGGSDSQDSKLSVFSYISYDSRKYDVDPYDEINEIETDDGNTLGEKGNCDDISYDDGTTTFSYGSKAWIDGKPFVANGKWLRDEPDLLYLGTLTNFLVSAGTGNAKICPYSTNNSIIGTHDTSSPIGNLVGLERIHLKKYSDAIVIANQNTMQIWRPALGTSYLSVLSSDNLKDNNPGFVSFKDDAVFTTSGTYILGGMSATTTRSYPENSICANDLAIEHSVYKMVGLSGGDFAMFGKIGEFQFDGNSILKMSKLSNMAAKLSNDYTCVDCAMPKVDATHNAFGRFYRDEEHGWGSSTDWRGTFNDHRFIPFFMVGEKIGGATLNKVYFTDGDILDWNGMSINGDGTTPAINTLDSGTGTAIDIAAAGNYILISNRTSSGFELRYLKITDQLLVGDNKALNIDYVRDFNNWNILKTGTGTITHLDIKESNGLVMGVFLTDEDGFVIREKSDMTGLEIEGLAANDRVGIPKPKSIFCQKNDNDDSGLFFAYAFDESGHLRIRGWEAVLNTNSNASPLSYTRIESINVPNDSNLSNRVVLSIYDSFDNENDRFGHEIYAVIKDNSSGKIYRTDLITRGYSFSTFPNVSSYEFEPRLLTHGITGGTISKIAASRAPADVDEDNLDVQLFAIHLTGANKVMLYKSRMTETTLTDATHDIGEYSSAVTINDISFGTLYNGENDVNGLNILCTTSFGTPRKIIVQQIIRGVDTTGSTTITDTGVFDSLTVRGLGRTPIDQQVFVITTDTPEAMKFPYATDETVHNIIIGKCWDENFGIGSFGFRVRDVDFFTYGGEAFVMGVDCKAGASDKKVVYQKLVYSNIAPDIIVKNLEYSSTKDLTIWNYSKNSNFITMGEIVGPTNYNLRVANCELVELDSPSTQTKDKVLKYKEVETEPLSSFVVEVPLLGEGFESKIARYMFFNNKGMWRWLPKIELKANASKGKEGHIAYLTQGDVDTITKKISSFTFEKGRYNCSYCAVWDEELKEIDPETGEPRLSTHYAFTFDFSVYAIDFAFISSDIESLCQQLPRKCQGIDTLDDGNYVINLGADMKILDTQTNRIINLELDDMDLLSYQYITDKGELSSREIENVIDMYPFEMAANRSIFLVANSGLLVKIFKYHKERCFENPMGEYKIFDKRFFDKDIRSLFRINDRDIIIGTRDFGTYMMRNLAICTSYIDEHGNVLKGNSECITSVLQDASKEYAVKYLFSSGSKIYNTINTVNSDPEITKIPSWKKINSLCAENDTQYAMCTSDGLYITELHYDIDDELHRFSIESVSALATEEANVLLYNHIRNYHELDDFWVRLYKKAPANLNRVPSGFTTSEGVDLNNAIKSVFNDIVKKVEFNDSNKYIKASARNWATDQLKGEAVYSTDNFVDRLTIDNKTFDLSEIPYTCKFWESGMVEFMIYVPTTLTFYMNNPRGYSNSQYSGQSINRPNVEQNFNTDNTVPGKYTSLRLLLNNEHFKLRTINEIQINGNSLPLRIYKDDTYCQEGRENLFDSVIQPSLVVSMPHIVVSTNDSQKNIDPVFDGEKLITLEFAVYGSDAQSIRILANQ